jgi:catechol 2,3-dioxygenase-like lactoylglutathione lyase family enzyme
MEETRMKNDVNTLHHVGLITSNMDAVIKRYEQLGFSFTPLSMPRIVLKPGDEPKELGVGNRCAMFRNNYLEVLGLVNGETYSKITKAQRGPYDIDGPLGRYEGLHVMHFGTDNLEAVRERLVRQKTPCSEIKPFQRLVDTPNGPQMMRAQSLFFPQGSDPEALIQIAQHLTPELMFQPRYQHHRNTAQAVTGIIVCAPDPLKYAEKYRMYTGSENVQKGNAQVIDLGYSRVTVIGPEHIDEIIPGCVPPTLPYLAGFTIAVSDINMTGKVLGESQIAHKEHAGRLIVDSGDACGCAVIFEREKNTL